MKRAFFVFLILLLIYSTASASVISNRYAIPETDMLYSIEFPSYFQVLSTEMDEYDPAVTVFNLDHKKAMSLVKEAGDVMIATTQNKLNMSVYIDVTQVDGFSSQELSFEELKEWAHDLASAYYDTHEGITPIDPDNLGRVYPAERVDFVYWSFVWEDEGTPMFSEHFTLFEPDYMMTILFIYDTSDTDKYSEAFDVATYIIDSVSRHK